MQQNLSSTIKAGKWEYPVTKTVHHTENYFGQTASDPYRWLENLKDPEVNDWFHKQAAYTNAVLAAIPGQKELAQELRDYDTVKANKYLAPILRGNRYFFSKRLPGEEKMKVYYRNGLFGEDVLIFDPTNYVAGKIMDVNWNVNTTGDLLLLNLAEKGKERGFIAIKDVASGEFLPDKILHATGWFSALSNNHILYTQYINDDVHDPESNLNTPCKLHVLGTPVNEDKTVFSRAKYPNLGILPEDYPVVITYRNSEFIFGYKMNVSRNLEVVYAPASELEQTVINWKPLCVYDDEIKSFISKGDKLYCITSKNCSTRKLIQTTLPNPDFSSAREILKGDDWKIESIDEAKEFVAVTLMKNGVEYAIKKLHCATGLTEDVALPFKGTIQVIPYSSQTNECSVFNTGWAAPGNYFHLDLKDGKFENGGFYEDYRFPGTENIIAVEVEVPSHDGAIVPLSIYYDKSLLTKDGNNIGYLYGYGAYGISMIPAFVPANLALLKRGVVMAIAHIRGGGEKGEQWHLQGRKKTKPNTWKDFNACAEYLIQNKFTSANKLACSGGSAGGILIGRAITERPDLYKAAIPKVGCLNATRMEFSPNGPVNVPEFGTVSKEEECKALIEMDAYLHVKPGEKYPAQLVTTGFNDPRVISWEPAKFAAAMQAANTAETPVLLYVDYNSGHFGGNTMSEWFEETAKIFAFLFWQCGHPDFGV